MTKVLFIGNYLDSVSGWSQACINFVLALDSVGVDVVCRPIILNKGQTAPPKRILELQAKSAAGCDVVIQNVLPHLIDYNGNFRRNIGLYYSETSDFRGTSWADKLNTLDAAWVCNWQMADAARRSGVSVPLHVVDIPCGTSRYQRSYGLYEGLRPYKEQKDFLFYTIGEYSRRKNLPAVVKAFHLEFHPDEPVQLVIKASKAGMSADECFKHIDADNRGVKGGLRLYGGNLAAYKKEIIIADPLTETGIMRLHETCDCFVTTSLGEAWSIPAFDAMAMGKTPIVPDSTGFPAYLSDAEGWVVKTREEPAFGAHDAMDGLCLGTETWSAVDIKDLRRCMREAYEGKDREEKSAGGIEKAYQYSFTSVGLELAKLL